jgi:hypothetical protein
MASSSFLGENHSEISIFNSQKYFIKSKFIIINRIRVNPSLAQKIEENC